MQQWQKKNLKWFHLCELTLNEFDDKKGYVMKQVTVICIHTNEERRATVGLLLLSLIHIANRRTAKCYVRRDYMHEPTTIDKGRKTSILNTQSEPQTMAVSNEENMLDNNFDEQSSIIGIYVLGTFVAYVPTYARTLAFTLKMASAQKFHASRVR